ncbi:hypothetical protein [Ekhidna sp.]|jgi:hypothetical protein|uniref:hypothetical protein n=1 Tax=Ekhidna sp. TaxID=2608089 RepID=UPI0032EAF6E1
MRLITLITLMLVSQLVISATQTDKEMEEVALGNSIMEKVFVRFHTNYEMSRLHKMGYYKESVSDSNSIYYLAEGIVDVYIPSNLNHSDNAAIYPIKTRKKAFKEIEEGKLLFGNASDMARSSIWRPNSFLNEKNRDDYVFTYSGSTKLNSYEVTIVEFSPANSTHGNVKGKIYIDPLYYGIVRIEYTPLTTSSKVWEEVTWSENFEFRNGAYEMVNVTFKGKSTEDNFHYEAMLAMDQQETLSEIPNHLVFIGDNIPLFAKATEISTDSFWEGFEFLKNRIPVDTIYLVAENH